MCLSSWDEEDPAAQAAGTGRTFHIHKRNVQPGHTHTTIITTAAACHQSIHQTFNDTTTWTTSMPLIYTSKGMKALELMQERVQSKAGCRWHGTQPACCCGSTIMCVQGNGSSSAVLHIHCPESDSNAAAVHEEMQLLHEHCTAACALVPIHPQQHHQRSYCCAHAVGPERPCMHHAYVHHQENAPQRG